MVKNQLGHVIRESIENFKEIAQELMVAKEVIDLNGL